MLVEAGKIQSAITFEGLEGDAAATLLEHAEIRSFSPNECIIKEGDKALHAFYVVKGLVRLSRVESGGREADVCVCEPGEMFGEYLMAGGGAYPHSAWSADYSEVGLIELAALRRMAVGDPALLAALVRILSARLLKTMDCVAGDRLHTASQKVANYFLARCPEGAEQTSFMLPYQKRILAGKLGLGPEALSRAFAALEKTGVKVRGRAVHIENIPRLRLSC